MVNKHCSFPPFKDNASKMIKFHWPQSGYTGAVPASFVAICYRVNDETNQQSVKTLQEQIEYFLFRFIFGESLKMLNFF